MRGHGYSEEHIRKQIAQMRSEMQADFDHVDLWACNLEPWGIFSSLSADWTRHISPAGSVFWAGIPTLAIHAAVQLYAIPSERWPQLTADIRSMESAAAEVLNAPKN